MGRSGVKCIIFVAQNKYCMSFIGNYTVKTDAKNRIAIPASFRKLLTESGESGFVLQKDIFQKCLVLHPLSEWNAQMTKLRSSLNPYNSKHKRFKSQFLRNAVEVAVDSGGRILLPKRLMQLVDIDTDVEVAGADTSIEIWNKSEYDNYGMVSDEFAALTDEILGQEQVPMYSSD